MLISYQWLCELLGADPSVDVVVSKLTAAGLEIEGVKHVGMQLRKVVVARIVSRRPHPTSKNPLTLVTIECGDGAPLEVVCGAPNVPAAGGLVCFAAVGSQVLGKDGKPLTLEAKPIAGFTSTGMLCAEDELGLGTDHSGIVVLDAGRPGEALTSVFRGFEDRVLQVNVTPNRPDALGHIGIAREVAALTGLAFRPPEPTWPAASQRSGDPQVSVRIEDTERCPRYAAAVLTGVTIGPSPLAVRVRLHRLGVRPINNIVDITNVVMLEHGQPMHAFDHARLAGSSIVVRRARDGEILQTLDGTSRTLGSDDLVIADDTGALALAGIMGGEKSGISSATKAVVFESAFFEPRGVRRSARKHALHSESSHRFERTVDVSGIPRALARAVSLACELTGATLAAAPIDSYPEAGQPRHTSVRTARVARVLGTTIDRGHIEAILKSLGFDLEASDEDKVSVRIPTHRPDIEREIDLIEEVGRVWGFDRIAGRLPPTSGARAGSRRDYALRRVLRETLASLGLDETVGYEFIGPRDVQVAGFADVAVGRIANPLSIERSVMRPSLLPGLLAGVARAHRYGVQSTRLFEVGTVFGPDSREEPGLLSETTRIALVLSGPRDAYLTRAQDTDFFDAKGIVEALTRSMLHTEAVFATDGTPPGWAHPRKWATIAVDGIVLGVVAELHPDVRDAMDLPRACVAAEFDAAGLGTVRKSRSARIPGRFPTVRRDIALLLPRAVPAGGVAATLRSAAGPLCDKVELFDRYAGSELPAGTHSLAFALWFQSNERTLTDAEVDTATQSAVSQATARHDARQR